MKANILGTEWNIKVLSKEEEPRLEDKDGFADDTVKEIVIEEFESYKNDPSAKKRLDLYSKKVIRHEIIHAFLSESGLDCNSEWACNEEMIDFFAIQFPKMLKVFNDLECL